MSIRFVSSIALSSVEDRMEPVIFPTLSMIRAGKSLGMISENGNPNPTHFTKIVWGIIIAAVSAILIMTGGLSGLQSALVAIAVPIAVLMLVMCYSTYKGLRAELIIISDKKNRDNDHVA